MKKYILILFLGGCIFADAQSSRGPKIGYFDMTTILKSVPEFAEANNQLELKAQQWKKEIDDRQAQINLLIEELKTERVLLTKELIEEKEEEIAFLQNELSDYQQKRFGPLGDLYTQKAVLVKPIQDQVFSIVKDIAERRNYDFIYDMSSASNGLIHANKRFDMNDEIINALTRAAKRDQAERKRMSKEEEQAEDDKKYDPDLKQKEEERQAKLDERQKIIDEKKAERDKKRQQTQEERQKAIEERKKQIEEQRAAKEAERERRLEQRKKEIEERKNANKTD
ncbi:MAG: OmpH family outer membrane protein [Flavobacteriaceae bacterium]